MKQVCRFIWPALDCSQQNALAFKIRKGVTFYWGVHKSAFSIKTATCAEIRIEANTADRRAASPQPSDSLRQSSRPATPTRIRSQSILRTYLEAQSILHTWSRSQFYLNEVSGTLSKWAFTVWVNISETRSLHFPVSSSAKFVCLSFRAFSPWTWVFVVTSCQDFL